MEKKLLTFITAIMALAAVVSIGGIDAEAADVIPDNVTICSTDVSGMTADEAQQVVDDYLNQYSNVQFTLTAQDKSVTASGADLSLGEGGTSVVEQALNYGSKGGILERYRAKRNIEKGKVKNFDVKVTADSNTIQDFLQEHSTSLNDDVVNNGLTRENGEFVFIEGKAGVVVNREQSAAKIIDYIANDWDGSDATIELVCEMKEPEGTEEELKSITDLLGSYTTDFSSSSSARAQNVKNGASKINGTVLYPGETLSVYETVSPFSAENGYELAGSYENGTTVETYGGGICQVSTTLYNAVMRAELEIVTRSSHSMIVSYVEPSMDAAIAGTAKDFQFKNNKEYPVYIEGYTSGGNIYFNIYGKETRPANRKVTFESEITSQTDPVKEFSADGSVALGTITRLQGSHTGYTARLWKIVTVDGVEESRNVYNNSRYNVSNSKYAVGTAGATQAQIDAINAAIATQDEATIRSTVSNIGSVAEQTTTDPYAQYYQQLTQ